MKTLKRKKKTKENLKFCYTRLWNTEGKNATVQRSRKLDEVWKNCYGMEGRQGKQTTSFACFAWMPVKILSTLIKGSQYNRF